MPPDERGKPASSTVPAPTAVTPRRPPSRVAQLGTRQRRQELDSRALEAAIALVHGLRTDIDDLERRLSFDDPAPVNRRLAGLERDVELLRVYLDKEGIRPSDRVSPPEFVGASPIVTLEATEQRVGPPPLVEPSSLGAGPTVTAALWAIGQVRAGELRMEARTSGVSDGAEALFKVFVRGDDRAIAIVEGVVRDGLAEATWRFGTTGKAVDLTEDLIFTVEAGGASAESTTLPGLALERWKSPSEA